MPRFPLAAALLALLAGPADAAPLCRDLKGLFTPCTGERERTAPRARRHAAPTTASEAAAPMTGGGVSVERARPPLIAPAKLCRDLKGLFTPCPR